MVTSISSTERSIRNEVDISHIKKSLDEQKADFVAYKEKVEDDKKHQEKTLLIKLSILATIISTILASILVLVVQKYFQGS